MRNRSFAMTVPSSSSNMILLSPAVLSSLFPQPQIIVAKVNCATAERLIIIRDLTDDDGLLDKVG